MAHTLLRGRSAYATNSFYDRGPNEFYCGGPNNHSVVLGYYLAKLLDQRNTYRPSFAERPHAKRSLVCVGGTSLSCRNTFRDPCLTKKQSSATQRQFEKVAFVPRTYRNGAFIVDYSEASFGHNLLALSPKSSHNV